MMTRNPSSQADLAGKPARQAEWAALLNAGLNAEEVQVTVSVYCSSSSLQLVGSEVFWRCRSSSSKVVAFVELACVREAEGHMID